MAGMEYSAGQKSRRPKFVGIAEVLGLPAGRRATLDTPDYQNRLRSAEADRGLR
jgi:hypothetical protein